ncbi:hypothetical protein EZS27_019782 [termite gut metagenome]|uniref:Uncharacterized protein n=1 Tax=termite gut metagenome TaxID=433724 RepID=A0A5J4RD73_9ZZZZ
MLNLASGADSLHIPEIGLKQDLNNTQMKTIALKLGLSETATEEEILSKIGALQTQSAAALTLQADMDKLKEKAIEEQVDTAIKLKKVTADKRAHFIGLGKTSGIESLKTTLELMVPPVKPTSIINNTGEGAPASGDYKKLSDVPEKERIELRKSDRSTYAVLYKAEYGFEPEIED